MTEKFRTLIVDDDELVLELMKHVARRHEALELESTTDSALAIERIRTREKPFHIILADLVMPHFTGLDVLRSARMRSPDTMGIIVTGFGDKQSTAEAIKLGVSNYLRKPFRREELDLAFNNAIAHFHMRMDYLAKSKRHEELKTALDEQQKREALLQEKVREMSVRLNEFKAQEKAETRLEAALAQARHAKRSDVRQFAVMRQLHDLGTLYQRHQISDEEFHSMRKSLLDKAYKSIIV